MKAACSIHATKNRSAHFSGAVVFRAGVDRVLNEEEGCNRRKFIYSCWRRERFLRMELRRYFYCACQDRHTIGPLAMR